MDYDKIGAELIEMFGDNLPNHVHEPRRFAYYIYLYRYIKALENEQRG
jgi:hypothetical protein